MATLKNIGPEKSFRPLFPHHVRNGDVIPLHNLPLQVARENFILYEYSPSNPIRFISRDPLEQDVRDVEIAFIAVEELRQPPPPVWVPEGIKTQGAGSIDIEWKIPGMTSMPLGVSGFKVEIQKLNEETDLFDGTTSHYAIISSNQGFKGSLSQFSDGSRLQHSTLYRFRIQTLTGYGSTAQGGSLVLG